MRRPAAVTRAGERTSPTTWRATSVAPRPAWCSPWGALRCSSARTTPSASKKSCCGKTSSTRCALYRGRGLKNSMNIRIVRVRKNGHSLGVNLPVDVVRELGVRDGDPVSLGVRNGVLILAKLAAEPLEAAVSQGGGGKVRPGRV